MGRRAVFALKNPRYAARAIIRELALADEKFIARITGKSVREIRGYIEEPFSTAGFGEVLDGARDKLRSLRIESANLFAKKVLAQYAAVRALEPECIVETGIANGVSSMYLLLAVHKNNKGRLHSIGLDDPAFLPEGAAPGWLVPEWLRDRWQTHIGDARQILPSVLSRTGPIDIFIHDSLHTYEHMMWEFETAYPAVRTGGLLLSDDALWNESFYDFARSVRESDAAILRGVGFLRKNSA